MNNIEKALGEAVAALYFDDSSDYAGALWNIVALLGGEGVVEMLLEDGEQAYQVYAANS